MGYHLNIIRDASNKPPLIGEEEIKDVVKKPVLFYR